ncbi:MAG: transposase [Acidobacteria bacterium]|nr:transposase [Acidobacteriota bacterium]
MVVVRRFGGALNLNIHLHALVLDGVFANDGGAVRFHPVPRLTREDVAEVVALIARRVTRLVERRGSWRRWRPRQSTGGWHSGRERARASGGAATHRKTSRLRPWDSVTPTPAGSICTPDWWSEPANGIDWSGCAAMRCGRPWPRSGCTGPVRARSG